MFGEHSTHRHENQTKMFRKTIICTTHSILTTDIQKHAMCAQPIILNLIEVNKYMADICQEYIKKQFGKLIIS